MFLSVQYLLQQVNQHPVMFALAVVIGIIPGRVRTCKQAHTHRLKEIEIRALLWHLTWTRHEWQLTITGLPLLPQRGKNDK